MFVPGGAPALQNSSLPGHAALQLPFGLQPQPTNHMYRHQVPAPSLPAGHALRQQQQQQHQHLLQQQQPQLRLATNAQIVRPSFSHIGNLQPAQTPQASTRPNQPPQYPVRPNVDPAASMANAGYMHGANSGGHASVASPRAYPLKPGKDQHAKPMSA